MLSSQETAMKADINTLSPDSKVWVFQANKPLAPHELQYIANALDTFCESWTAHNQALAASWELKAPYWLVVAVDERQAGASGCSIDKLMHLVAQLEQMLDLDFRNRELVALELQPGQMPTLHKLMELKTLVSLGQLHAETPAFDNLVASKAAYDSAHRTTAGKTWLSRYMPKMPVVEI